MPYGTSYINQGSTGGGGAAVSPPNVWQTLTSSRADGSQPSSTEGTPVTPGVAGVKGAWTSLGVLSASQDTWEIELVVHTVFVSGSNRMVCIDIGVDTAGGTSFTAVVADVLAGAAQAIQNQSENRFRFPIKVPAGASVGVRSVSLDATVTAFRVIVNGFGSPSKSSLVKTGTGCQTLGASTSGGTFTGISVTPGTTSEGAWVDLGTLAQDIFALEYGLHINNTTINQAQIDVDLAIGDAGTKTIVIFNRQVVTTTGEAVCRQAGMAYVSGAAGQHVYIRAQASASPAASGIEAAAYGVY